MEISGTTTAPLVRLYDRCAMQRPMGNMETALQLVRRIGPMSVVGVLRLHNPPPVDRIRTSLDTLQSRHPLLRTRIVGPRDRLSFQVSEEVPPIPLDVIRDSDEGQWRQVVETVLNHQSDVERGPLLSVTFLGNEAAARGDLIFAYDHSIMDSFSASTLFDQFLRSAAGGSFAPESARSLWPPIDELVPDGWRGVKRAGRVARYLSRQIGDEIAYRWNIDGRAPTIHHDATCRATTRTLTPEATKDLIRRARAHRLTMNSVAAAALIVATHQQMYPGESMPMRAMSFADLRHLLRPPPPPDELGCYISMLRHTVQVEPRDDLWTVASRFQSRMRRSIDRHEQLLAGTLARQTMKMLVTTKRMRMATTAVSYAGVIPAEPRYGEIEVDEIHGFISNNRLGPISTAFTTVFRGRLTWDFVFLDTDMDPGTADQVADATTSVLLAGASA
jgi:hypothetical protein